MKKTLLSYTALDNYTKASHTWICKMMGIETPVTEAMEKGKEAHKRLQAHLMGTDKLPIELDWNCTAIEYHAKKNADDQFMFHGFLDAVNFKSKVAFEIKTSGSSTWGQSQFNASIQPKYYSWVTGLRKFVFITCHFDLSGLKVFYKEMSDADWNEAEAWANKALQGIKNGEFSGGLVDGKCQGCMYGNKCYFI